MQTDFLVIGSGIAGLTALKVAEQCTDKKGHHHYQTQSDETNTKYAQGGVAGVMDFDHDSFNKHIEDTLVAGDGLCNRDVVEVVVKEGLTVLKRSLPGVPVSTVTRMAIINSVKRAGIAKAGYCTIRMSPAREMERALLETIRKCPNIELISHCFVLDIITQHHLGYLVTKSTPDIECYGVYVLNLNTRKIERSDPASLCWQQAETDRCTGRPPIPPLPPEMGWPWFTAPRAALKIWSSSSFTQRLCMNPVCGHSFLITEAVREMGNTPQCFRRGIHGALRQPQRPGPADIVARAIDHEMKINGTEYVYLDCRHMDIKNSPSIFPISTPNA